MDIPSVGARPTGWKAPLTARTRLQKAYTPSSVASARTNGSTSVTMPTV